MARVSITICDEDSTVLDQFDVMTEAHLMGGGEKDIEPHILAGKLRDLIERKFSTEDRV